jgi:hypothetical protein
MTTISLNDMTDRALLDATVRVAGEARNSTAELLKLLGELDARRLYLSEGSSSLFTYCTGVLHLSEHAAYHRIEAARAARLFPVILELVEDGSVTLTTVTLLRPHLTLSNHRDLLDAARHKSKRDVEHQIACLAPRPDATPQIRRIPSETAVALPTRALTIPPPVVKTESRPIVAPLSSDRFLVRVTVSGETHAKLRRAQELMRHMVPDGDPARIVDRALTLLIDHLERAKLGKRSRSAPKRARPARHSRYIPASVRENVWTRDEGRCAFVGPAGRCRETAFLEFHHVVPFARGGATSQENLALRCRAHNQFEGELSVGEALPCADCGPVR